MNPTIIAGWGPVIVTSAAGVPDRRPTRIVTGSPQAPGSSDEAAQDAEGDLTLRSRGPQRPPDPGESVAGGCHLEDVHAHAVSPRRGA